LGGLALPEPQIRPPLPNPVRGRAGGRWGTVGPQEEPCLLDPALPLSRAAKREPQDTGVMTTRPGAPPAGEYVMAKQATEKKSVTDADLAKLVAKHRKANPEASASAIIKALRSEGYSFSGKRVRVLVAGKLATPPKKATSKRATKKPKPTVKSEKPTPNKDTVAAKIREQEEALGINR
jgi:hypothetical protein